MEQVMIIGNLGRDPEMRFTPSGQAVTNFSVAVSRKWKNRDGQQQTSTKWFRISAWGNQAEVCNKYLSKGKKVMVIGTLTADESGNPRVYTKGDGTSGAAFELNANQVEFLSASNGEGGGAEGGQDVPAAGNEEEIPF